MAMLLVALTAFVAGAVNAVAGDTFSVLIIPHTLKVTTWGTAQIGMGVNLEVDLLARYAARLTEAGGGQQQGA